jgi:hypothetical protein
MKTLKGIATSQRHHFMKCECGEYFDMRDTRDVMRHLHKSNDPANTNGRSHSVKIRRHELDKGTKRTR